MFIGSEGTSARDGAAALDAAAAWPRPVPPQVPAAGSEARRRRAASGPLVFTVHRTQAFLRNGIVALDVLTLFAGFVAAYWIRDVPLRPWLGPMFPIEDYLWLLGVIVPSWLFLLHRFGFHDAVLPGSVGKMLLPLARVQLLGALLLFSVMALTWSLEVSRLLIACFVVASAPLLLGERLLIALLLRSMGRDELLGLRKVVIAGTGSRAAALATLLESNPHQPCEVIGFLSRARSAPSSVGGKAVLGSVDDFAVIASSEVVDEVVAVSPSPGESHLALLAALCLERGITFRTMLDMPDAGAAVPRLQDFGNGTYLLSLETVPQDPAALLLKRVIDVVGALVGLCLTAVVYLWYRRRLQNESPGPVFFHQLRVAQNGRCFVLYKFRTMVLDAEARRSELRQQNEMKGLLFKMREDPRIVPSGSKLRRHHLDELPQFWNVLKGEMSLVGTRPPTPDEVADYAPRHRRRLSMKPGLTGYWQIQGNGKVDDFEEIVKLDCDYISNWSLGLDFKLLAQTIRKVVSGEAW